MADSTQELSNQTASAQAASTQAPSTLSATVLQHRIDEAAHLNVLSAPVASGSSAAIRGEGGIIGVRVEEQMHRFSVTPLAPTADQPLRAVNRVGQPIGTFEHLWMLAPDDFVATPGKIPPPTPLDPSRSQRLVMLESQCRLDTGENDSFSGFGTGHTVPTASGLQVLTVGTILRGNGRFAGHDEGTYLHCGKLDPERGFTGNLLLRVMDPEATLSSERSLPPLVPVENPDPDATYIVLRGEAVPSDPVKPKIGPNGQPIGLVVEQGIRLLDLDVAVSEMWGVRARARVGRLIGRITADVVFDPKAAAGTLLDPIPFSVYDSFELDDGHGATRKLIGTSEEGRVFNMSFGGAQAIRFGGVGRVLRGDGPYAGIQGLLTDNSVVVFEPHVSASVYVLRIEDPEGRFRADPEH